MCVYIYIYIERDIYIYRCGFCICIYIHIYLYIYIYIYMTYFKNPLLLFLMIVNFRIIFEKKLCLARKLGVSLA